MSTPITARYSDKVLEDVDDECERTGRPRASVLAELVTDGLRLRRLQRAEAARRVEARVAALQSRLEEAGVARDEAASIAAETFGGMA